VSNSHSQSGFKKIVDLPADIDNGNHFTKSNLRYRFYKIDAQYIKGVVF